MNTKTIEILMGDKELTFNVTLEAYNNCVNSLQVDNKVAPMHNFLIIVSAGEKTKEQVNYARDNALTADLFGVVVKEFKPDVEITVKKSRTGHDKLIERDSPS